jgi:hypothetical protein
MELQVLINCETEGESHYNVYEHSINNGVIESAIKPYIEKNGLKRSFITDDLGTCESKLFSLVHPSTIMLNKDVFGIYRTYNDNGGGQLFKCTYYADEIIEETSFSCDIIVHYVDEDSLTPFYESGETQQTGIHEEIPSPKGSNTYQIVGVTVSEEPMPPVQISETEKKDEKGRVISKTITWQERVKKTFNWWECEKIETNKDEGWSYDGFEITCGDGEIISRFTSSGDTAGKKTHKYRNVTVLEAIPTLGTLANDGDIFFFLSRYDNGKVANGKPLTNIYGEGGEVHAFDIPFKEKEPLNCMTYDDGTVVYDAILSKTINTTSNTITIDYAIGMTSGSEMTTGIHYRDVYGYEENVLRTVPVDGVSMVDIYCNTIIGSFTNTGIYGPESNAIRQIQYSKIIGMEVGSLWTSNNAIEAMLFTSDGFDILKEEPKCNVNLLYNRGSAAAWENHFKLSECNTMEDLENYGNNFFNL